MSAAATAIVSLPAWLCEGLLAPLPAHKLSVSGFDRFCKGSVQVTGQDVTCSRSYRQSFYPSARCILMSNLHVKHPFVAVACRSRLICLA